MSSINARQVLINYNASRELFNFLPCAIVAHTADKFLDKTAKY